MRTTLPLALILTLSAGQVFAQSGADFLATLDQKAASAGLPPGGYYPPVPSSPEEHQAWLAQRQAAKPLGSILSRIDYSPAFSLDPDAPNWYLYHGIKVPLRLWADRLAVQFDPQLPMASRQAILASVGLTMKNVELGGSAGWGVYELTLGFADCTAVKDAINAILKAPGVRAASPVFHAPLDPRLWIFPAAEVSAQTGAIAVGAVQTVHAARPDLAVLDVDWGGCPGMVRLASPRPNGFETLKAALELAAVEGVQWSEPLFLQQVALPFTPNDANFATQWWLRNTSTAGMDMGARRAWNVANGSGIRVVVVDNGFQRNHPDVTFAGGRDFTDGTTNGTGDGSPGSACDRHGTPCGGIIAASTNNSTGVAGAAFGGQTYVARVMYNNVNADGTCAVNVAANAESATLSVSWVVNGLNWGGTNGCRISSQSIIFGGPSSTYETAVNNLHSGGMSHFCSSGNDGSASISYPASYAGCNSVGSVDNTGTKTNFSQYGSGLDFTAPGTSIFTTDRSGMAGYNTSSTSGDYTSFGGTSSAAPVAAGTAALALSAKPWLTAGAMETDLVHSTIDRGTPGYDTTYGWGIINAYNFMVYPYETQPNDQCGNATYLGSSSSVTWSQNVTSAIDDSVAEAQESCEAGGVGVFHSVWYSWTAPTFGTINVDTLGSNYDTVLSIWDGCGLYNALTDTFSPPTQLGCNDDISGSNLNSAVSNIRVKSGQTVRIKVSRYGRSPVATINSLSATLHLYFTPGPPTNNACNSAEPVTFTESGGYLVYESPLWDTTLAQNLTGCSANAAASCANSSKPVWWSFTAPGDGVMLFQTVDSSYDTVLSIYDRCGQLVLIGINGETTCFAPTQQACNDDVTPGTLWSQIGNFTVLAGQSYKVRLAAYGTAGTGGLAKLRIWFSPTSFPPPVNDACSAATVIPSGSSSFADTVSNMGATVEPDCGDPPANTTGTVTSRSVWWTFTPASDGLCSVDTIGSNFDTTMTIYDASSTGCAGRDINGACVYPDYVTFNEDSGPNFTSVITDQPLVAGHVYLIRVAGWGTGSRGTVNFNFTFTPAAPMPPANDAWAAAIPLSPDAGSAFTSAPIDTRAATSDIDCGDGLLSCTGDPVGNSIWFAITPLSDGFLAASTLQSDYNTVLAVFDASSGGPTRDELGNCIYPPEIACNDDVDALTSQSALNATLLRDHTYLIAIFARDAGGLAVLDSTFTGACPPDLAGLGGVTGPDGAVTVDDLVAYLNLFFAGDSRADFVSLGGTPGRDGEVTVDDLVYYLSAFFSPCP